jgi:hypothetical protein
MTLEQLALLGIVIFGFMAVVNVFNAIRTYKRVKRMKPMRVRRLVGGRESAMAMAESLIKEIMAQHPEEIAEAMETKALPASLEERLNGVREYYLSRVEPVHKPLFNEVVNALILSKE